MRFKISRRRLLKTAAAATAVSAVGGGVHFARREKLRVAVIGGGMRGRQLAELIRRTAWYSTYGEIVAVCDVHRQRADDLRTSYAPAAEVTQDYRKILERDDVEAVFIATPDHSHVALSLAALAAGKHVYCEKPVSLTIAEGRMLATAVRKQDRVFLVGTQQRSSSRFQTACALVRNGRIGVVQRIEIGLPLNFVGGPFPNAPPPAELAWDDWLNPTPPIDYCPQRFEAFRGWYEYSGGSITDWGAHHLDIVQWALGREDSGPCEASGESKLPDVDNGFNTPAEFAVELKYADGPTVSLRSSPTEKGILFIGDAGRVYVNRRRITGEAADTLWRNPLPADAVQFGHVRSYWSDYHTTHVRHFYDCIRRGDKPLSDAESQHRSATACHLANIALRLDRTVRWNPQNETFVDDPAAAGMISRNYGPQRA